MAAVSHSSLTTDSLTHIVQELHPHEEVPCVGASARVPRDLVAEGLGSEGEGGPETIVVSYVRRT